MQRWVFPVVVIVTFAAFAAVSWGHWTRNPDDLSLRELGEAAGEAYIYAYPLLVMDQTRAAMLAAPETQDRPSFTINRLSHIRRPPRYGEEAVVRPSLDTLYSIAWLDLSEGPVILRWPEMGERYWLFQVMDAWTDVAGAPGTRTRGSGPGAAMISGPGWDGPALPGMAHIGVDTNMAWIIGRIEVSPDQADLRAAGALQDQFLLSGPDISAAPATPPALGERPPEVVAALGADEVVERLLRLIAENPPRATDGAMAAHLRALGVGPGASSADQTGWVAEWAIGRGVEVARQRLVDGVAERPYGPTGWRTLRAGVGDYGANYGLRAGVALMGLGANLPEDAIYPTTDRDADGSLLSGNNTYRIRFEPHALPPTGAFWSITAYDASGFLLESDRHAITDRDPLVRDGDGGLTLTIGRRPLNNASVENHLPTPSGEPFQLTARLYLPDESMLSGEWRMPPVERISLAETDPGSAR